MSGAGIIVRAVITGLALSAAGGFPWSLLAGLNLRVFVRVPWAILPMGLYLWAYWRYLGGAGPPRSTAELRRTCLRANRLSSDLWPLALLAGVLGLAALLPLLSIASRLVRLPVESQPIVVPPQMPFATAFVLLVMASIVAGVVEEAAFRGYMQGPIERRYGPVVAILVSGAAFGVAHFTHHAADVVTMLPFYIAVSAVYGGLAFATNSILPGLVLHAAGDVFSLTRLWITGRPEWQIAATPPPLVWESGVDAAFLRATIALALVGAAASWAYWELARAARERAVIRSSETVSP
jgi:membrane protease YdiL (CAAX protease family)